MTERYHRSIKSVRERSPVISDCTYFKVWLYIISQREQNICSKQLVMSDIGKQEQGVTLAPFYSGL